MFLSRIGLSAFCLLTVSTAFAAIGEMVPGVIEKTVDGDTLWVQSDNKWIAENNKRERLKIRMVGIDAPESHLPTTDHGIVAQVPWGEKASAKMAKLAPVGVDVTIDDRGLDKYGRTLGRVLVKKKDANLQMVQSGWAIPYILCEGPSCNKKFFEREKVAEYLKACDNARDAGKGVFDPKDPMEEMPFEFRLRMQNRKPDKYVGDFKTKELYRPADYDEVDTCQRIFFPRIMDAKKAGYTPVFREDGNDY